MSNICNLIEDLLPLYIEGLTKEENTKLIEEHLLSCDNCKARLKEMKENILVPETNINHATTADFKQQTIESRAFLAAKVLSKYQNVLKLSLASLLILFSIVITCLPVTFFNTLPLIILATFVSRLFYGKTWPLLIVNLLCSVLGGIMVSGGLLNTGWWVISIGQLILMTFGILAGINLKKAGLAKAKMVKKLVLLGVTLIFLGLGSLIYAGFCGNPVSYFITQNKVSSYISKTYTSGDVKITGIFYTWDDGSYTAKASKGAELFSINVYRTGYVQDNYNMDRASSYMDSYSKMVETALASSFKGQYFWIIAGGKKDDNITLEQLVPTKDMDLIIRFADNNGKNPPLTVMSQEKFLELSENVVKVLDDLKLTYNDISFQAIDVDEKDMSIYFKSGLTKESIIKAK